MAKLNFQKLESKWQKSWDQKGVFQAKPNKKKKKLFFTTPYPYISGSLHIGHGRVVTESDIYCRFKRMMGFNVLYPMSFHITGTPVLGISAAIKNKDKSKIAMYESYVSAYVKDNKKVKQIVKSFEDPQKIVDFFIPKMVDEYKQLGLSVDWRRRFTSGDMEHQQMVIWQFEKYKEKGYLVRGKYPILYSPEDESAMGEDDIQDADTNPVEKQEYTILKFKFKDKFLVAATLRPETVFGQTNLWVNPSIDYVEAKVGAETWVMSKEAYEKLKYQRKDISESIELNENLIGQYVVAPMINRELIILPSRFVDSDVGTGIVTSVPSDAPYDHIALKELQQNIQELKKYKLNAVDIKNIKVIPIIKTKKYGDEAGVKVVEDAGIKTQDDERLTKLTQEVYKEGFHSGVLTETCGTYSGMKVIEAKEKMKTEMIENKCADIMYDVSRKSFARGGGKIVVAVLDDQWFIDFNAPGWKDKAYNCLDSMTIIPEMLRKQFKDTFDWLDKRPCARRRGLGTQLPFNKEWIIESLSDSTMYMTLYTINHLIKKYKLNRKNLNHDFFSYVYLGKGTIQQVSKNTKVKPAVLKELRASFEYWMPVDHRHTFVLHLQNHLSFMIFAFSGIFPKKYWPKKISFHGLIISEGSKMSKSKGNTMTLLEVKKKFGADVFRFYLTSTTNIFGTFDWSEKEAMNAKNTIEKIYSTIDDAIKKGKQGKVKPLYISKFNSIIKEATSKLEDMKLREYDNLVVYDMFNLLKDARLSLDKNEMAALYNYVVENWIKLISPVCPHIAEELWSKLGKKSFVSTVGWPKADEKKIDAKLEQQEKQTSNIVSDVKNIFGLLKEKQGKEAKQVYIYVIPNELQIYNEKELRNRIGKPVKVFAVNDKNKIDPEGKSKKAKPGKPGIYIE